jgi:two-component system, OmpR family, alkaline phosphatase synthesis response regulator PhoP
LRFFCAFGVRGRPEAPTNAVFRPELSIHYFARTQYVSAGILARPARLYNRPNGPVARASLLIGALMSELSHKSRILIADDNGPNVELIEAYLNGLDCEIAIAVDGRDTLAKVASFQPDLILLDVMMPKLSGFEVCERLKSDPATRGIMILMVTALNELGDIERAVEAGTDDFLSKPVNKLELLKRVDNMLKLHHVTDEVERLRQYIAQMEDATGPRR